MFLSATASSLAVWRPDPVFPGISRISVEEGASSCRWSAFVWEAQGLALGLALPVTGHVTWGEPCLPHWPSLSLSET